MVFEHPENYQRNVSQAEISQVPPRPRPLQGKREQLYILMALTWNHVHLYSSLTQMNVVVCKPRAIA